MTSSYRDAEFKDIQQRMHTFLALVRNWFLAFLLLFVLALVYWALNPKNIMGAAFSLAAFIPLLALGVQYVRENNTYRREAPEILTESLDLETYDQVLEQETLETIRFQTNWDRIIIRRAQLAWLRGEFKEAQEFLQMVDPVKVKLSPKERTPLLLTYYLVAFANKAYTGDTVDPAKTLQAIDDLVVQNDEEARQKSFTSQAVSAMATIIVDKEVDTDFESLEAQTPLEAVLDDYLQAENARLAKEKEKAKKAYKRLTATNSELYMVREAKAAIKEMK